MAQEESREYRQRLIPPQLALPGVSLIERVGGHREVIPRLEHTHREKFEFILVRSGIQRMNISGVEYTGYPGQALVIRPGERHAGIDHAEKERELLWFQLEPGSERFLGLPAEDGALLRDWLLHFSARQISLDEEVFSSLDRAFALLSSKDPVDALQGRSLFCYALIELMSTKRLVDMLSPEIDRTKRYILSHITEQIDGDELLGISGLSHAELKQRFAAEIGVVPREYILQNKIEQMQKELASGERDLAKLSYAYHFSSVGHFKLKFKEYTGKSVGKYLRELRRSQG